MKDLIVVGPRDKTPEGFKVINVTSRAKSPFSPFYHGCNTPIKALRMENAWQFSKVYEHHDRNGHPVKAWFKWRQSGLEDRWAHRYPFGKGAIPLYSWFDGEKLDYVEARKKLYVPLYKNMLERIDTAVGELVSELMETNVALWDFDGYYDPNKTFEQVLNDPKKKMGHAFVLKEFILERK